VISIVEGGIEQDLARCADGYTQVLSVLSEADKDGQSSLLVSSVKDGQAMPKANCRSARFRCSEAEPDALDPSEIFSLAISRAALSTMGSPAARCESLRTSAAMWTRWTARWLLFDEPSARAETLKVRWARCGAMPGENAVWDCVGVPRLDVHRESIFSTPACHSRLCFLLLPMNTSSLKATLLLARRTVTLSHGDQLDHPKSACPARSHKRNAGTSSAILHLPATPSAHDNTQLCIPLDETDYRRDVGDNDSF
jgi:hypothetical protein